MALKLKPLQTPKFFIAIWLKQWQAFVRFFMKWFLNKRKQVASALPRGGVLALASWPERFRQRDVKYPYRQDSAFYYMTGFEEPEALFLLFPSGRATMFCAGPDPIKDLWEGPRMAPSQVQKKFLLDEALPLSELEKRLPRLLKGRSKLIYNKGNGFFDRLLKPFGLELLPADDFLKDFRRIKDETEISHIQKAIAISIHAHKQVARALKPGINENSLYGVFLQSIREKGALREAYPAIVACGANACVLHYQKNNAICQKGQLLLLDAGAESGYYSSDITRVYPVSGKFSPNQKSLYEKLLVLQKSLIQEVGPSLDLAHINQKMNQGLTRIMMEAGFLPGSLSENLQKKACKKYSLHSVSHLMGLDVHDDASRKMILQPGMVLTIEPGIYIPSSDPKAPPDLRGAGFRIEDDILVTSQGRKNLSQGLCKEPLAIEALCQSK